MITLKLRQSGWAVNHKRVERLYTELGLQVRKRRRKKIPVFERQPLIRPAAANTVWSMDFVFDRTAEGRVLKILTVVDDATHDSVVVEARHWFGGGQVVEVLKRLAQTRGRPKIIRSDNGKEFIGRAMLNFAHRNGIDLRPIEPGKPNHNAYIESFNGRFRDECLNENRFLSLSHARQLIERWQWEYNNERPKKALDGLTPAEFSKQLKQGRILTQDSGESCFS
jgi:transposase InsO family protein